MIRPNRSMGPPPMPVRNLLPAPPPVPLWLMEVPMSDPPTPFDAYLYNARADFGRVVRRHAELNATLSHERELVQQRLRNWSSYTPQIQDELSEEYRLKTARESQEPEWIWNWRYDSEWVQNWHRDNPRDDLTKSLADQIFPRIPIEIYTPIEVAVYYSLAAFNVTLANRTARLTT